jgi:hypothetical protein
MANYRIKAQKTGPRTFKKELQMISYQGSALYSEEGNALLSEKDVYYPPDFLSKGSVAVVVDSKSYKKDGLSLLNKFSKGRPAALPIKERFPLQTEVSRSLLGVNRAEVQQGIFDDVSSYGLERKDWVVYKDWPDRSQGFQWEFKNSVAGKHDAAIDRDSAENSSVVLTSYPVPFYNPGNEPISQRLRGVRGPVGEGWGKYLQSLIAMYVIEYMVNNFTSEEKEAFRLSFLERNYPKTEEGKFDRLYWDKIWLDIDQGRFEDNKNIPIIPQGRLVNFVFPSNQKIDINFLYGADVPPDDREVDPSYSSPFFATTRYAWVEPNNGHYSIRTNPDAGVWQNYWGIDYESFPDEIRDWEFGVYESEDDVPDYVKIHKFPYFLIQSKTPSESLIFGRTWPQFFSDPSIPQISGALAEGNLIGARDSNYSAITLTSIRAFRYQPGRISGFTYGVRVSDEGAGPGSLLEWGVENPTDGYFFRLRNGTDFAIVRRSTIPLGQTPLFIEAGYQEREVYVSQTTGVVKYKDELSATEILEIETKVREGTQSKAFETLIEQNQMNGDGLNSRGDSGYIYNPSTVTMYKIEFGWYGAIGARFYMYIPQANGQSRWVVLHTLVIENQLGKPCLEDPFFYFKYRVYVDNPSRIRLPQFIEKYGASYYIDGGDEGTVNMSSGKAVNRSVPLVTSDTEILPIYQWASVLGIKPKQIIVNTEGNQFNNKKEIFPVSASITSTTSVEVKFVNQFGCKEHGYTFQEGYRCVLPEKQRLRGLFNIRKLQTNSANLVALGRAPNSSVPTITYLGPDESFSDSVNNLGGEDFLGWDSYGNSLHGSHLIADNLYCAYLNPTIEGDSFSTIGFNNGNREAVVQRVTRNSIFNGLAKNRPWSNAELLYRYGDETPVKISPYRKDTTLLSTVEITSSEFYLLFSKQTARDAGGTGGSCRNSPDAIGCDGSHFGDYEVGVIWPRETPASYSYPTSIISKSRSQTKDFGIIAPNNSEDQDLDNEEVAVIEDDFGLYYVQDKKIPNSETYRYYEGLPINLGDPSLRTNIVSSSQASWVSVDAQGLERSEGVGERSLGNIDIQFPNIPGADGGECHAIYGRVGEISVISSFTNLDAAGQTEPGIFYISSSSSWPSDLWSVENEISIENENTGSVIRVQTIAGRGEQRYTPPGTSIRFFLLPVTIKSGVAFDTNTPIKAKYQAVNLYETSLTSKESILLDSKIAGQNIFPLRFFIRMREGANIGSLTIGQVTPNGIIQTPFTPHGSTLSVNNVDFVPDLHDGGAVANTEERASKAIVAFSEPGSLLSPVNYSYYDVSQGPDGIDKSKKCPSFISRDLLSGAGFSGSGDYPIRWLKFKESGEAVASYFIPANTPTEIDLSSIFNINSESIGPNFWGNKALFMIARNIASGVEGKMSVTFNYKEQ